MGNITYVDPFTKSELIEDKEKLVIKENGVTFYKVKNGIPDFSEVKEEDFIQMIKEGNWIEKAWKFRKREYKEDRMMKKVVEKIIEVYKKLNSPVLEIACGPGGGFVPALLINNSEIQLLMTDIVYGVVNEWRKFFNKKNYAKNIEFAACDARYIPLSSNNLAVITSIGIENVNDLEKVFNEVYRVLKPGGLFITGDMDLTQETREKVPEDFLNWYNQWCQKRGQLNGEIKSVLNNIGFSNVEETSTGTYNLDPEESTLGKKAKEFGVELCFDQYQIQATK